MQIYVAGMDQDSLIADIERRAWNAGLSMNALCRHAGVNPTTFSRWKKTERNPDPVGPTLRSIRKLHAALAEFERGQSRRSRKAAHA